MSSASPQINTAAVVSGSSTPADTAELELFARQFFRFIGAEITEQIDGCWSVHLPPRTLPAFDGRSPLHVAFRREQKIDENTELLTFGSYLLEQIMEVIRSWDTIARGQLPAHVSLEDAYDQIRAQRNWASQQSWTSAQSDWASAYRFLNASPQWQPGQAEERFYVLFNLHLELRTDERTERLVPVIVDLVTGAAQAVDQHWQTMLRGVEPLENPAHRGTAGGHPGPDFPAAFSAARQVGLESLRPVIEQYEAAAQQRLQREWERLDAYYNELEMELLKSAVPAPVPPPPGALGEEDALADKRAYLLRERQLTLGAEQDRHRLRITIRLVNALLVQLPVMVTQVILRPEDTNQQQTTAPPLAQAPSTASLSLLYDLYRGEPQPVTCDSCSQPTYAVWLCRTGNHIVCAVCGGRCSHCHRDSCAGCGLAACSVDGQPVCRDCAAICASCHRPVCPSHRRFCSVCGESVCQQTSCTARCAICHQNLCTRHQVVCSIDGHSGPGIVCPQHAVTCTLGHHQVCTAHGSACLICGQVYCVQHGATCGFCGQLYCRKCVAVEDGVCQTCASLATIPPDHPYVRAARGNPTIAPLLKGLSLWRGGANARYAVLEGRRTLQAEVLVLQLPSQEVCFWRSTHILERVGLKPPTAPEMPQQVSRLVALQDIVLALNASSSTPGTDAQTVDTIPDEAPLFYLEFGLANLFLHRMHTHVLTIGYYAPGDPRHDPPRYTAQVTYTFQVKQDTARIRLEQRRPTIAASDPAGMWKVSVQHASWIPGRPAASNVATGQPGPVAIPNPLPLPIALIEISTGVLLGERIFRLGRRTTSGRPV